MVTSNTRSPTLFDALIPLVTMVILLAFSVYFFGADSSGGANQIAMFIASGVAILVAMKNGHHWKALEHAIANGVSVTVNAILILLMVGAVIGTWIVSGTVPTMIYYGLKLIDPGAFYVTTCIVCALASLSIGSSWSVIGTIGLGLFGVATTFGLSPEITAGAIISGAYFGDKMSPLSDTTNLSPAVAGTDLFTHIRHMTWTTFPAIGISLVIYTLLGLGIEVSAATDDIDKKLLLLETNFNVGLHLLLPVVIVIVLAVMKFPALPAMMISALAGIIIALIFQQDILLVFAATENLSDIAVMLKGVWVALFNGYVASTSDADMNELLSRGGMSSILNTIWLVLSAMMFASIMDHAGFLQRMIRGVMALATDTGGLIVATVCTCIGVNIVAADQYIAIVLPARIYRIEYKKMGLAPQNLSRTLEDAGTVTSPLVPWNTCGAFIYGVLGISAFAYAPYCFFNLFCPIISCIYGILNFKVTRLDEEDNDVQPKLVSA
ncbi:MAG: Na+/H+ antiporter NhaC [Colwellia sp.]|nr:Na+/H+ antiporter NhaC [Colwellia sp.]